MLDEERRIVTESAKLHHNLGLLYLRDGDFESAWNIIDWVDTAVRDDVPARLYNFIAKENGYN